MTTSNLLARIAATTANEMVRLANVYNTQYLVECGDEIILATDSLVEAAKEIEAMPTAIKCVVILMSRNGDAFEVVESFFGGKPHRPVELSDADVVALMAALK